MGRPRTFRKADISSSRDVCLAVTVSHFIQPLVQNIATVVLRGHPIGLLRTHFRLAVFGFLLDGVFRLPVRTDGMTLRSFGSSLATSELAPPMFK